MHGCAEGRAFGGQSRTLAQVGVLSPPTDDWTAGRARGFCAVVLLVALLLMGGVGASTAEARYRNFHCVWKTGPEYRFTILGKHLKSTTYFLEGFGTTCSFAKQWVARLAKEPYRGTNKPVHNGPPGWRCRSARSSNVHPESVFDGNCQNRKDVRRVFLWQAFGESQPVEPPVPDPPPEPDAPA